MPMMRTSKPISLASAIRVRHSSHPTSVAESLGITVVETKTVGEAETDETNGVEGEEVGGEGVVEGARLAAVEGLHMPNQATAITKDTAVDIWITMPPVVEVSRVVRVCTMPINHFLFGFLRYHDDDLWSILLMTSNRCKQKAEAIDFRNVERRLILLLRVWSREHAIGFQIYPSCQIFRRLSVFMEYGSLPFHTGNRAESCGITMFNR